MANNTTIQLSIETHGKLSKLKTALEEITNKKLSYDQVINIVILARNINYSIMELL